MFSLEQAMTFDRDGFLLIDDLFTTEVVEGLASRLSLWRDIGDDLFGAVSASPRIVNGARALLREEVYHWHSKVMLKEPRRGGAWEWHQDYGYWYHDGCPYPRLL